MKRLFDSLLRVRWDRIAGTLLFPLIRVLLLGSALAYVAVYCWVALSRARYPFDLEWMEGAMVDHVRRLLEGRGIYREPSLEFVPYVYGPFYYWVCAPFAALLGIDYFALRLVSTLSTLVTFALLFWLVRRETRSAQAGLVSVGLFAATYPLSGCWFDLARVDSLALALSLGSACLVRAARRQRDVVLAAALLVAAFTTKQTALLFGLPSALHLLSSGERRWAAWFVATSVALCAGFVGAMTFATGGWYWFYVFVVPSGHAWVPTLQLWKAEILGPLAIAVGFSTLYVFDVAAPRREKVFHVSLLATLLVIAGLSRAHLGSYANDDMTAHLAFALGAGLGSGHRLRRASEAPAPAMAAAGLLLLQFGLLPVDPRGWVPTPQDWQAAARFDAFIKAFRGPVYVPDHGHVGWRAGKGAFVHEMAVYDLFYSAGAERYVAKISQEMAKALAEHRFAAIITDTEGLVHAPRAVLEQHYQLVTRDFLGPRRLYPRTGLRMRPTFVYVPRGRM